MGSVGVSRVNHGCVVCRKCEKNEQSNYVSDWIKWTKGHWGVLVGFVVIGRLGPKLNSTWNWIMVRLDEKYI